MNVGNRVYTQVKRPSKKTVQMFKGLPSSNINDELNRLYCMNDYIQLMNPESAKPLLGTAITVKVPSGDNLFFHQALDMAEPGDVIVVDGGSCNNRSLCGELMMRFAQLKGIAGVIVDGCIRDLDGIGTLTMPVYAIGVTPQGPFKNGPGEVNVPIACGGQVVCPGDILVGDQDGIVVIHPEDAVELAQVAAKKKAGEDAMFESMNSDIKAYCQKHINSTQKRMEGKTINFIDGKCK